MTIQMNPDRRRRHAIYKRMLKIIDSKDGFYRGLCDLLYEGVGFKLGIIWLPELNAQEPSWHGPTYWWEPENWTPRRRAVKKAIELSAPKPRKQKPSK